MWSMNFYPSGAPYFIPSFSGVCLARLLLFCVMFCFAIVMSVLYTILLLLIFPIIGRLLGAYKDSEYL